MTNDDLTRMDTTGLPTDSRTAPTAIAEPEQCICAAIQLPNGEVWRGHRHDSAILTALRAPDVSKEQIYEAEQGFITSRNRFVGRDEGAQLQRAAGILSAGTLSQVGDVLFSEDLYLRDWRSPVNAGATPPAEGVTESAQSPSSSSHPELARDRT